MKPIVSKSHAVTLSSLFCLSLISVLFASDSGEKNAWPHWRGPSYNDATTAKGIPENPQLDIRWTTPLGSGYSAVVVAGDQAVTMASDGVDDYLIALASENGQLQWRVRIDSTFPGTDGANDGPVSTPAIDAARVYALGPRGKLIAVARPSGETIWTRDLQSEGAVLPHWGFTTSPLVYGDMLLVATGAGIDRALSAYNKDTGDFLWAAGTDTIEYQSPLIMRSPAGSEVLLAGFHWFQSFDPANGTLNWRYRYDGDGFYRRILNPLVISDGNILLKHRRMESKLIHLDRGDGATTATELWDTEHIKLNYNLPVYHQGYLYGHSGRFLVCVDAADGSLVWKSRPPGDGFLILVGEKLVILTKSGTLHLAVASPDGYVELAQTRVFEKAVWTPPSFANGHIYARDSFKTVCAVDVLPSQQSAASPGREQTLSMRIPGSDFNAFIERVQRSQNKSALIDEFMRMQKQFPVIEKDTLAHIIYRGEVEDLVLLGDMLGAGEVPMNRVPGTDFYYASFALERDAFVTYRFARDYGTPMTDPLNPRKGKSFAGEVSELLMPGTNEPTHFRNTGGQRRGTVEELTFDTPQIQVGGKTWGGMRKLSVYLPYGYGDGEKRYRTLYVNYGEEMLDYAGMANTLDHLIGRSIRPIIVIFLHSLSSYEYARSQRHVYAQMLVEDIVPHIDSRYRTLKSGSDRAIMGVDEGGYAACYLGFSYPGAFGKIAAQSIFPGSMQVQAELQQLIMLAPEPARIYLDWGKYDSRNPERELDVRGFCESLYALLQNRGYDVAGGEVNEGGEFASWRRRTDRILETLFPLTDNPELNEGR